MSVTGAEALSDPGEPLPGFREAARTVVCLSAGEVLGMHASLHRTVTRDRGARQAMAAMARHYARDQGRDHNASNYLHPAPRPVADLAPWLASLGNDLYGARTYQVTEEMVNLALALQEATPDLGHLQENDLPCPCGFMWFDKPVDVNPGHHPAAHAVSWAYLPRLQFVLEDSGASRVYPGVRLRYWCYAPGVLERQSRHLRRALPHLAVLTWDAQMLLPVGPDAPGFPQPEVRLLHMVWILCGTEVVTAAPEQPDEQGRKDAANLRYQDVRVVRLRRAARRETGAPRHVDWSCTWLVRGHWRSAPHGGTFSDGRERTWVRPYVKGPDGEPLRASDILYKLSR